MPDEPGPLLILSYVLRSPRPPSLAVLLARFASADDYRDFVALVREYLPEREQEILRQPCPSDQMAVFINHFEDRYFPLEQGFVEMVEGYDEFTSRIPVKVMGIGYDDYHDIPGHFVSGYQLMTYLMMDPYGGPDSEGRIALAEACRVHVPAELLARVPRGGLDFGCAHRLLDGTPYEALARWGDILTGNTGTYFLDLDYEYLCQSELPDWCPELVEDLSRQWRRAEVIQESVNRLVEWLGEDPPDHFRELLDFIEGRMNEAQP